MYGIDLGINIGSVVLVSGNGKEIIDYRVYFGPKPKEDTWGRIIAVADGIVDAVTDISKHHPDIPIAPLVSIEECIYSTFNKNARGFFILSCLYALVRNKLEMRRYQVTSVHPMSAKKIALDLAFKGATLKQKYYSGTQHRRSLNKKGMILAYKKLYGEVPNWSTIAGRETIADSTFIARCGLAKLRIKG